MKGKLKFVFSAIIVIMVGVTLWSSLEKNVLEGFHEVAASRWGWATLADAYCGFLTVYCWVFYKRPAALSRLGWLVAILAFGNIAMAIFVLLELYRLKPGEGVEVLLAGRKVAR